MIMLHRIRQKSQRLARVNLALFALVWLSIVVAPCAMATEINVPAPVHDCPHCPPQPCHELEPQDCDPSDALDSLPLMDKAETNALSPAQAMTTVRFDSADAMNAAIVSLPPVRAGPRPHLVNAQFNE
ncbi:MAG: hypothetical protein ACPGJE_09085 [Wenzhouxiangellaceae bacterium]